MMNELDKACGLMSADDAGMADGMPEYAEEWRSFEMKADHLCAQPEAGTSRTPSPQSVQTGDFQAEFWDAQDAGQDASAQQPNCGLEGDEARLCMNSAKSCHACGTTNTPQWRGGPNGPQTLCNACGLQFNRNQARAARQASASSARPAPARAPDSPSGGNGSGGSGMSGRSGPKHAGSKASSRQQDAPTGCEAAAPAAADATAPRARPMRKAAMVAASRTVLFARAVEMDLDTEMDEAGYAYAYGTNELDAAEHHTEEGCGHHGTAGAGGDGEHGSSEENGDEGGMGAGRQDAHPGGLMRGELMGSVACSMVDLGELAAHDGMSMLPPPPASSADASAAASRKRRASTGTAVGLRSSGAEVVASNMPAAAKRRASHGVDAEAVGAASDAGATAAAMGPMPRIRIRAPPPLLMPKAVAGGAAAAQQHVLTPALEQSAAGTKHTAPAPANSDKKRRSNGMAVPAPLLAPAPRPPRVPRVLSPSAPALLMPASAASHTVAVSAVSARAPAAAVAAPVPAASQPHAAVTGTGVSLSSSAPTPVVQIGVCAAAPIAIPAVGAEQSASPASASAPAVAAIAFAAAAAQQQRAKGRRPAAAAAASASAIQDSKATPPADGDVHAQAAAAAHMMGGHEQMDVLSPFGEDTTLLGPGAGASNGEDGFYHFDQFKFETEAEQFKFEVEEGGVGVELEQPQFLPSSHKVEEEEGQLLQFESHHTQYGGEMMNMVYGGIHGGIPAADDAYGLPHMLPASLHVMASCSVPDQMLPCSAYEGSCGELGGHEGGRHTGMHPSHHPNSRTPSPGMAQMCGSQPNLNLGLPPLSGTHLPVGQPLSHLSGACPRNGTHGLPAIRRHSLGAPPPSATATGPFCMGGAPTGPVLPAMGTIMEDGASRETTLGQPAPARACAGAPAPLAPSPEPCIYTVAGGDGSGGIVRGSCGSEGGVSSGASGVSSAACLSECCGVMKRMEWMLGECGASHTLPNEAVGELRAVGGDVQRAADEASAAGAALAAVQRVLEARHAEAERAHQAALAAARRMSDLMATLATKFDLPGPPVDMVSTGEVCMGTAYLRFPLPNTSAGCQPPRTNTPVPLTPAPRPLHAAPFTGSAAASAGCDGGVLEVADLGVTATDCMVTAGLCDLTPLGEPMEMDLGSSLVGDLDIGLSLMI